MPNKPFAEKTGIGKFLSNLAPTLLDLVGEFPDTNLLTKLIKEEDSITPAEKLEAEKLIKHYNEVELTEHLKDIQNARLHDSKIQESQNASSIAKTGPYIMDFMIIGSVIILSFLLFIAEIPSQNKEISLILLGVLSAKLSDIFTFHRGSSQSSKDKSLFLEKLRK